MYSRTRRPFSPEEKAILEGLATLGRPSILASVAISLVLGWAFFAAAACVAGAVPRLGNPAFATAIVLSVIAMVLTHRWRTYVRLQFVEPFRREAQSGEAEIVTCTVTRAAEAEVFELDCGPAYFLEVDAHRTLFLAGQYLLDASPSFPSAEFELVLAPLTLTTLALRTSGAALPLSARVDLDERNRAPPEDGAILDAPFDDVVARYPPMALLP